MKKKINIYLLLIIILVFLIIKGAERFNDHYIGHEDFRNTSHLILTKHARCRMDCRHITMDEIKEILENGKINRAKGGIGAKGDSTYALDGYSLENQHLRVVVAPENRGLVVITCIDLDKEWQCDCN